MIQMVDEELFVVNFAEIERKVIKTNKEILIWNKNITSNFSSSIDLYRGIFHFLKKWPVKKTINFNEQ